MSFTEKLSVIKNRLNPVTFDRRERFIFFPNNKVCQRSIAGKALADRVIVYKQNKAAWEKFFAKVNEEYFSRVFTFTVVRNPYDRAVSAFTYLQGSGLIDSQYSFSSFCKEILREQGTAFDPHFDPQSDGLFYEGELIPQFLARFESIGEDFKEISLAIDGPRSMPHINKSKRRKNYADYYDDAVLAIISEIYADDIRNFGYEFENSRKRFFLFK